MGGYAKTRGYKRLRAFLRIGIFLFLMLMVPSCSSDQANMRLTKQQCERFYHYIRSENVDSISTLFGAKLGEPSQRELFAEIELNREDLGDIVSAKLEKAERNVIRVKGQKQDVITITYKVEYDSSYYSKEQFYFHLTNDYKGIIDSMSTEKW
jgi:hypothetical protein